MKCTKCDFDFDEKEIQEHHVHPRFMDNENGNGMKCYLCKKCHNILHFTIPAIIWRSVPENIKDEIIKSVIKYTKDVTR